MGITNTFRVTAMAPSSVGRNPGSSTRPSGSATAMAGSVHTCVPVPVPDPDGPLAGELAGRAPRDFGRGIRADAP